MNEENIIKPGDWVYVKSKPEIIIKVPFINPNGIVDFRNQRSEEPQYAHLSDLEKITDQDSIIELEIKLSLQAPNCFL